MESRPGSMLAITTARKNLVSIIMITLKIFKRISAILTANSNQREEQRNAEP